MNKELQFYKTGVALMGLELINLESVLLKHYELYPEMQIQDMVKLIYQNEFG